VNIISDANLLKKLKQEKLRYASDNSPGYFRQKINGKYAYYDLSGKRIADKSKLERIEGLVIPPAWKKVWIAPRNNDHVQATGIDDRKRKQYIYHPDWIKISQENKFAKMLDFGKALPLIRGKVRYDLSDHNLSRKKVIATIVWLLENTLIRIGNEQYSEENNSYGLTTFRNRHVKVKNGQAIFNYVGKSGIENTLAVNNPAVVKVIKKCVELPGYELFQYVDDDNNRHVIDSSDVNEFLKDITKDDFSAKDFRTWGATNLSAHTLYKIGQATDPKILKQNINETVKKVASHLNNTVSVCRNYYIHPHVIKSYETNLLVPHFGKHFGRKPAISGLSWNEEALLNLLQKTLKS